MGARERPPRPADRYHDALAGVVACGRPVAADTWSAFPSPSVSDGASQRRGVGKVGMGKPSDAPGHLLAVDQRHIAEFVDCQGLTGLLGDSTERLPANLVGGMTTLEQRTPFS